MALLGAPERVAFRPGGRLCRVPHVGQTQYRKRAEVALRPYQAFIALRLGIVRGVGFKRVSVPSRAV